MKKPATGAYHKFEFVRNWPDDHCVGFMEIWTIKNSSEKSALEAVKAALTEWVATTEDGRDAYGSYERLEFGDLLNAEPWTEASFNKIARMHGIKKLRAESVGGSDRAYNWDEDLVDEDEVANHKDPRGEEK